MKQSDATGLPPILRARSGHIHMLGICGVGMAGLAVLLKQRGFRVSGCDSRPGALSGWLEHHGIEVQTGHDPGHWSEHVDVLIRSAAVPDDNPEVRAASRRGVPVCFRGEVLPAFVARGRSIAVSGTHGKTTTTAFTAQLLAALGQDPSWCVGGECEALSGVAQAGGGDVMVVEADESDGTVARYRPETAIVTNVEFDHMEHFADRAEFEACFRSLVGNARRRVVFCADDPVARRLCRGAAGALSYGFSRPADWRAVYLRKTAGGQRFTVMFRGERLGRVALPMGGRHNVLNCLAAIAAVTETGAAFDDIARAVPRLCLPRRRFEQVAARRGITVISDYAHHPSEIAALMGMVSAPRSGRVVAVFQPHRYTRTAALGADFPAAFKGVDSLLLLPVYAASESPRAGGTVWDLYRHFRAASCPVPLLATSLERAWAYLRGELRPGDTLLVVGAGDVEQIAARAGGWLQGADEGDELPAAAGPDSVLRDSRIAAREPLARKTTLGVGGKADTWVELASEADLARLCPWARERDLPLRILGGGSNVLVGDLGVRGIVARLSGAAFSGIRQAGGVVAAGASVPLARLLDWAERHGKAGLEFLEGIPGTVGGALRMNAGAWGESIAGRVRWIRCVAPDGETQQLGDAEPGFEYRGCRALESRIAVEAAFVLDADTPQAIGRRRGAASNRREWMRGMRSAGSVFRNPPGELAGRLLESVGMKGTRIGGAVVSDAHANVVRTDAGATAADVRALLEIARIRVEKEHGIKLQTEIVLWE